MLGLLPLLLALPGVDAAPAGAGTPTAVRPPASAMPERALLDFPDTEIEAVARAMSAAMGRPIAVDPRVKGRLRLTTDTPVTPTQAYALFTQALRGLGYTAIESGGLLKIVPEAEAKLQASWRRADDAGSAAAPHGDLVVTQVLPLVHESATSLLPVLRPLITANSTINVSPGRNALVVTDYESNLRRLATLVAALDLPSATDVEVIPLAHALAADLAPVVLKLSDGGSGGAGGGVGAAGERAAGAATVVGGSSGATSVIAEPHLNALLVRAPNPARLAAIRALVARLDQPGRSGLAGSNVHVVYLRNAEATRLATVLRAAFAGDAARGGGGGGSGGSGSAGGGAPSSVAAATSVPGLGGVAGGTGGTGGTSTASTTPVSATAAPSTGGLVQADPASNALIVTAAEPLFRDMREVIERLDTPRAQLYVESLVVEIDASRSLDIGLQWKQLFNLSASTELTLGTIAQAIESTAGTNILSTANLITLDNEEAKIVVGQNVPFVTGTYTSTTGTTTNPFQTIERKDVGITLRIRPQIGEHGRVRMTIFQESSSVASSTSPGTTNAGPTTNKRAIESTVVVDDGRIVVLGGLLEDSATGETAQIPGLGRLPLVGGVFRSTSRSRRKTNLVVFLRPVVMNDATTRDALSVDRYDQIRARQQALPAQVPESMPGSGGMPSLPAPDADGRVGPFGDTTSTPGPLTPSGDDEVR